MLLPPDCVLFAPKSGSIVHVLVFQLASHRPEQAVQAVERVQPSAAVTIEAPLHPGPKLPRRVTIDLLLPMGLEDRRLAVVGSSSPEASVDAGEM